jgi:putative ABC transport system ATP-binding protein
LVRKLAENKAMINLNNLHKSYEMGANSLHVLKGINLNIEQGDFVSIMGSSGSGKSTLLNILGMLDNYDKGTYYLAGNLISNMTEKKAAKLRNDLVGFVFQSFNLISFKNAMENVALPLYYKGVPRKKRNLVAMEYLDKMGLKEWADHMPNEMSGGQKQRVAIARALISQPKIILADEPTGALDTATSYEVMDILKEINETGKTVIIVTHEHDIAAMTNQIIRLKDGVIHEIIRNGELKQFQKNYMKELETA